MNARELAIFKKYGADGLAREAERQVAARSASRARTAPRREAGDEKKRIEDASKAQRRLANRDEVRARAGGKCEVPVIRAGDGSVTLCGLPGVEVDHFWGRAREESVESEWLQCISHARAKTTNYPSRKAWVETFRMHCERLGYRGQVAKCDRAITLEAAQHPDGEARVVGGNRR